MLVDQSNSDGVSNFIYLKKKGSSPFIKFNLSDACGGDSENPKYKLSGMWLSMIGNDGSTAVPSKGFGKYKLPKPVFEDFNADETTGKVKFAGGSNSLANDLIKVKNKNQAEYVVFFKIEAVLCESGTGSIWLDPQIENKGR